MLHWPRWAHCRDANVIAPGDHITHWMSESKRLACESFVCIIWVTESIMYLHFQHPFLLWSCCQKVLLTLSKISIFSMFQRIDPRNPTNKTLLIFWQKLPNVLRPWSWQSLNRDHHVLKNKLTRANFNMFKTFNMFKENSSVFNVPNAQFFHQIISTGFSVQ